jgi:hypothetical protein
MANAANKSTDSHAREEVRMSLSEISALARVHAPVDSSAQVEIATAFRKGRLPLHASKVCVYQMRHRWLRQPWEFEPPLSGTPEQRVQQTRWMLFMALRDEPVPPEATPAYRWNFRTNTMSYLDDRGWLWEYLNVTGNGSDVHAIWTPAPKLSGKEWIPAAYKRRKAEFDAKRMNITDRSRELATESNSAPDCEKPLDARYIEGLLRSLDLHPRSRPSKK